MTRQERIQRARVAHDREFAEARSVRACRRVACCATVLVAVFGCVMHRAIVIDSEPVWLQWFAGCGAVFGVVEAGALALAHRSHFGRFPWNT